MSRDSHSHPVVIAERQVRLGGRDIPCTVKRSRRARRVRFEIREDGGLTVVLPRRCSVDEVEAMVRCKSRWVLRQIEALARAAAVHGGGGLRPGHSVPYLGAQLRVAVDEGSAPPPGAERQGQTLLVRPGPAGGDLEPLVEAWYREQAGTILQRKAEEHAAGLGVTCRRVSIRGQRTRWASCSPRGTLSFNWRLLLAPEPVVDYVVVHEVAHLREMNHTARFWRLVAERCPSWREHRKWLNDHSAELSGVLSAPRPAEEAPRQPKEAPGAPPALLRALPSLLAPEADATMNTKKPRRSL